MVRASADHSGRGAWFRQPWGTTENGLCVIYPPQRRRIVDDLLKVWTTVGSVGTLNQTDLAKVSLHQSIIQLGVDLLSTGSMQVAAARGRAQEKRGPGAGQLAPIFPTIQAVVRYNVTPVDGLFITGKFSYNLQIRYRGQITAKLMQVDIENGAETQLIPFDSSSFPASPNFQVQLVSTGDGAVPLDFVNKAYYVEATLIAPALVVGNPAAISIIKVIASPSFRGRKAETVARARRR
jgi:hypothetical protein